MAHKILRVLHGFHMQKVVFINIFRTLVRQPDFGVL